MESIPRIIKDLGIPTLFIIIGLFLLVLTFVDLSRSEGKLHFKTREKYRWSLAIIAGILIFAGLVIPFTPINPDDSIQGDLENPTATISFLETQIAIAKSAVETSSVNITSLPTQNMAEEANPTAQPV